jgi:hypothetical protein
MKSTPPAVQRILALRTLHASLPAVATALVDLAQGGSVTAAALVFKLCAPPDDQATGEQLLAATLAADDVAPDAVAAVLMSSLTATLETASPDELAALLSDFDAVAPQVAARLRQLCGTMPTER